MTSLIGAGGGIAFGGFAPTRSTTTLSSRPTSSGTTTAFTHGRPHRRISSSLGSMASALIHGGPSTRDYPSLFGGYAHGLTLRLELRYDRRAVWDHHRSLTTRPTRPRSPCKLRSMRRTPPDRSFQDSIISCQSGATLPALRGCGGYHSALVEPRLSLLHGHNPPAFGMNSELYRQTATTSSTTRCSLWARSGGSHDQRLALQADIEVADACTSSGALFASGVYITGGGAPANFTSGASTSGLRTSTAESKAVTASTAKPRPRLPTSRSAASNADCTLEWSPASSGHCAIPTCSDGIQNQGETDIGLRRRCAGSMNPTFRQAHGTCTTGKKCMTNWDCA